MIPDDDPELEAAVARVAKQARERLAEHPEPAELVAFLDGALPAARLAEVEEHLTVCPECAAATLDLAEVGEEPPSEREVALAWRGLRGRLADEGLVEPVARPGILKPRPPEAPSGPPASTSVRRRPAPWVGSLAASLLVAVVGLGGWLLRERRAVEELSRPQVNAPVFDLLAGTLRAEGEEPPTLELEPGQERFTLLLAVPRLDPREGWRLELVDAAGRGLFSGTEARPDAYGSFTLTLAARRLADGEYRLRLWGRGAGGEEMLEEEAFRLVRKGESGGRAP
ncbi:MAG TPA: zf-HC2 domain-containing protein [Thermoanaerobaculia bacterium]|nr:zf-HC2 domain-containing protein [Thermoanaerobaculia bacterium]